MARTRIAESESCTSPVAARGVIARAVRAALDTHLDACMLGSAEKDEYFALVEGTRSRFAQLIDACGGCTRPQTVV